MEELETIGILSSLIMEAAVVKEKPTFIVLATKIDDR